MQQEQIWGDLRQYRQDSRTWPCGPNPGVLISRKVVPFEREIQEK